jgi:cytochrome d ubiquinol oxidase subunit I
MTFSGWVAVLAGWYVTEIGRQPYIVYGLVRTAEVATDLPSVMIASTLAMYIVLYVVLVLAYVAVIRYLAEKTEREESTPADLHSSAAVARTVGHAT